jgi:hypothetical protein
MTAIYFLTLYWMILVQMIHVGLLGMPSSIHMINWYPTSCVYCNVNLSFLLDKLEMLIFMFLGGPNCVVQGYFSFKISRTGKKSFGDHYVSIPIVDASCATQLQQEHVLIIVISWRKMS